MKLYELTYLISPDAAEAQLQETGKTIENFIQSNGGAVEKIENPSKKRLAYPINHQSAAFLGSFSFYLEPSKIQDLEKILTSSQNLLRFMMTFKPVLKRAVKAPKIFGTGKWTPQKEKKVALEEIEQKLGELLGE